MIDFTPWNDLLTRYVADGQVDYARWQTESVDRLDQWLKSVSSVQIDPLDEQSAIAFLINLYNALAIQQVLRKYPIDSIRPTVLGIPNLASFLRFFKKDIYTLNGQSLSLDNIEHDILRSRYSESRIHFALVCVSASCPSLRPNAYLPTQLNAQLQEDTQQFINNPEKVKYDAPSNTLYCSKIFKWYEEDFLKRSPSIISYIQQYLPNTQIPPNVAIEYLPYSWQLNQRTSS
ncbi:MAG: DUF547 domain-containing protein [Cyanobacteria bacterium P01_C01_bin.69]